MKTLLIVFPFLLLIFYENCNGFNEKEIDNLWEEFKVKKKDKNKKEITLEIMFSKGTTRPIQAIMIKKDGKHGNRIYTKLESIMKKQIKEYIHITSKIMI